VNSPSKAGEIAALQHCGLPALRQAIADGFVLHKCTQPRGTPQAAASWPAESAACKCNELHHNLKVPGVVLIGFEVDESSYTTAANMPTVGKLGKPCLAWQAFLRRARASLPLIIIIIIKLPDQAIASTSLPLKLSNGHDGHECGCNHHHMQKPLVAVTGNASLPSTDSQHAKHSCHWSTDLMFASYHWRRPLMPCYAAAVPLQSWQRRPADAEHMCKFSTKQCLHVQPFPGGRARCQRWQRSAATILCECKLLWPWQSATSRWRPPGAAAV
jgi:hypothetical protein